MKVRSHARANTRQNSNQAVELGIVQPTQVTSVHLLHRIVEGGKQVQALLRDAGPDVAAVVGIPSPKAQSHRLQPVQEADLVEVARDQVALVTFSNQKLQLRAPPFIFTI